jgi:ATP-dependent DNA ligase
MKHPTLYKLTKTGAIQTFDIYAEGADIVSVSGQLGGAATVSRKTAKATNAGRANERTPEVQAEFEAAAKWKKKVDAGYFETEEEARTTLVFLPMLASDFEARKDKVVFPAYVQPKFDGVRCLAYWENGEVKLLSRGGKPYHIPHIVEQVASILPQGRVLDGEIYIHGRTFQEITKLVKKYRPGETEELDYWVYDTFEMSAPELEWEHRLIDLHWLEELKCENIQLCPTSVAHNEKEVKRYREKYVERGFEGAIVREGHAGYEIGRRSNHLLKSKKFMDAEYKIVGHSEGVGNYEGCVIWECETEKGQRFNVVPKGTLEEKAQWYENATDQYGRMLKVKFFELTDDGIPRFPVGLGIRIPEDV